MYSTSFEGNYCGGSLLDVRDFSIERMEIVRTFQNKAADFFLYLSMCTFIDILSSDILR